MNTDIRGAAITRVAAIFAALAFAVAAQADWEATEGPNNAVVYDLLWDPNNPGVVYAATGSLIYKTMNGGDTWQPARNGIEDSIPARLAMADNNSNVVYAAGSSGWVAIDGERGGGEDGAYIFKTTNSGSSWTKFPVPSSPYGVAVHPTNKDLIIVGTQGGNSGLYRSTDGGSSWAWVYSCGLPWAIAFARSNPKVVYSCHNDSGYGILKSTDTGATWNVVKQFPISRIYAIAVHPTNENIVLVGVRNNNEPGGLWRSTDGGTTWACILPSVNVLDIEFDRSQPAYCYAACTFAEPDTRGGMYRSADAGATWTKLTYPGGRYANSDVNADNTISVAVNPSDGKNILAGVYRYGVYGSSNRGASWTPRRRRMNGRGVYDVAVDPAAGETWYVGSYGVWRRTPGNNWTTLDSGLAGARGVVKAVAMCPSDNDVICIGTEESGIWRTTNRGSSWSQTNVAGTSEIYKLAFAPSNGNIAFASCMADENEKGIYKSTDKGATWTRILGGGSYWPYLPYALAIDPTNSDRVFAGFYFSETHYSDIIRTTDGGSTWVSVYYSELPNASFDELVIDPIDPRIIYALEWDVLLKSIDGGDTWSYAGFISHETRYLAVSPVNHNRIYAACYRDDGVRVSLDGGASWSPMNAGLESLNCQSITASLTGGNEYLLVGTAYGLYEWGGFTGTGGVTFTASSVPRGIALRWRAAQSKYAGFNLYREAETPGADENRVKLNSHPITGSTPYSFLDVNVTPGEKYSYWLEGIPLSGRPEWYGPAEAAAGAKRAFAFALGQNAPNPCRTTTTISFSLPATGPARLELFDLAGRRVSSPVDGTVKAGSYTLELETAALPPGVYVYRLTAGAETASRRMVVTR